jgi:glycosyltransferase involved in cell wall biosynthesis
VSSAPLRVSEVALLTPQLVTANRQLRVLTLTPFYPSAEDGSQGGFIAEPLRRMETRDIDNHVVAVQPFYRRRVHGAESESGPASRWETYFSLPGNLGLPIAGAFLASHLLRSIREMHAVRTFDLIHAHGALPCGHAARVIARKLGIPFVVSVHGLDAFSTNQSGRASQGWCRRVSESVYGSAEAVICISEKVRQQLGAEFSANARVIYNGVDAGMFCPGPESNPLLTVLTVGNLIPIKGHTLLLRAFARVLDKFPDCSLEIFGDGLERGNLLRLAQALGISNRVKFHGRQSRETIAAAMQRCAVFALPSSYEGLGCVYLEAMASGKPAIGCRGQGIEEIIEHGNSGFLISPGGETELTNCLNMLLQNPNLRARMGMNARSAILQRHTLEHQARQLTEIYLECAR